MQTKKQEPNYFFRALVVFFITIAAVFLTLLFFKQIPLKFKLLIACGIGVGVFIQVLRWNPEIRLLTLTKTLIYIFAASITLPSFVLSFVSSNASLYITFQKTSWITTISSAILALGFGGYYFLYVRKKSNHNLFKKQENRFKDTSIDKASFISGSVVNNYYNDPSFSRDSIPDSGGNSLSMNSEDVSLTVEDNKQEDRDAYITKRDIPEDENNAYTKYLVEWHLYLGSEDKSIEERPPDGGERGLEGSLSSIVQKDFYVELHGNGVLKKPVIDAVTSASWLLRIFKNGSMEIEIFSTEREKFKGVIDKFDNFNDTLSAQVEGVWRNSPIIYLVAGQIRTNMPVFTGEKITNTEYRDGHLSFWGRDYEIELDDKVIQGKKFSFIESRHKDDRVIHIGKCNDNQSLLTIENINDNGFQKLVAKLESQDIYWTGEAVENRLRIDNEGHQFIEFKNNNPDIFTKLSLKSTNAIAQNRHEVVSNFFPFITLNPDLEPILANYSDLKTEWYCQLGLNASLDFELVKFEEGKDYIQFSGNGIYRITKPYYRVLVTLTIYKGEKYDFTLSGDIEFRGKGVGFVNHNNKILTAFSGKFTYSGRTINTHMLSAFVNTHRKVERTVWLGELPFNEPFRIQFGSKPVGEKIFMFREFSGFNGVKHTLKAIPVNPKTYAYDLESKTSITIENINVDGYQYIIFELLNYEYFSIAGIAKDHQIIRLPSGQLQITFHVTSPYYSSEDNPVTLTSVLNER